MSRSSRWHHDASAMAGKRLTYKALIADNGLPSGDGAAYEASLIDQIERCSQSGSRLTQASSAGSGSTLFIRRKQDAGAFTPVSAAINFPGGGRLTRLAGFLHEAQPLAPFSGTRDGGLVVPSKSARAIRGRAASRQLTPAASVSPRRLVPYTAP